MVPSCIHLCHTDQHGLVLVDPVEVERARDSAAHRRRTVQQRALRVRWQRLHREFENGVRDECHATMAQVDSCLDLLVAAWSAHQQNHHQQLQQSSGGTSFRDSISGQSATAVASEAESSTSSSSTSQPFMSDAALDSLLDDSLWDNEDDDAHVEDAAGEATSPSAIRPTSLFSSSSSSFLAEPMQPATQAPSVLRNLMMTHGLPANVPMDEQVWSQHARDTTASIILISRNVLPFPFDFYSRDSRFAHIYIRSLHYSTCCATVT